MKKYFKNFAIIWLCGVLMFAVIALIVNILTPDVFPSATFWIAYVFVLLAFALQLGVAKKFFSKEDKEKVFLNMPLITISKSCVIVSAILGTVLMVIPGIPFFVAAIVAAAVLLFSIVAMVKANTAAMAVEDVGKKVAVQTEFVKEMSAKAQNIVARAKTDDGKAIANKVYDAIRYSNKSSHGGLAEVEGKISANITVFADAVSTGDDALAESVGDQLIRLTEERDNLAKINKD